MTKRLTHQLTYDAPLAEVAAMLADPAFREAVCDAQRVLRREATVSTDGPTVVHLSYAHSTERIPSFARSVVGEEIQIVQTETWPTPQQGTLAAEIPGKPGRITGRTTLTESGGRTTQTVDLEVKVSVPLLGGKLEGMVGDLLLRAYDAEQRVGRDYLSRS